MDILASSMHLIVATKRQTGEVVEHLPERCYDVEVSFKEGMWGGGEEGQQGFFDSLKV